MNNKKVVHILVFISFLFLSLIVYLTAIEIYYRDEYTQSTFNQRNIAQESKILRGTVYDSTKTALAYSEYNDNGVQVRKYPYNNLYSHVIGYSSPQYGKSLLEKVCNADLLGKNNIGEFFDIAKIINGTSGEGDDVYLTLNHNVQKRASELMQKYNGALVAMNPKTGAIIAMVSKPDFNPNADSLEAEWSTLNTADNSPFLTRATMGLYAPGSTYKVVTTALMYENDMQNDVVNDNKGAVRFGDKSIANASKKAYGTTNLEKAFINSSNVYFAYEGSKIDDKLHKNIAERFMLNKKINFDFPYSKSKYQTSSMMPLDCAIASIGQGKTLTTPLELALIASTYANNGVMMKPYIVSEVKQKDGKIVSRSTSETMAQPIDADIAQKVKDLMLKTVQSGTGTRAQIPGVKVCGKTGTAENELTVKDESKTHAVFIGFAPYDDPQIAVSVVLEYAGGGGANAAPIAREVIKTYLSQM